MTNNSHSIFVVKTVTFEEGSQDPFGFDAFAEKLGEKYLPFSGSVSKPAYFLFTAYVNHILDNKLITYKNEKQKKEIILRLEKLLVYCWKRAASKDGKTLKSQSVIGNSYTIEPKDLFTAKGWIAQSAYKTYNAQKKFTPTETLNSYLKTVGEKQIGILKEFIAQDAKSPDFNKDKYINDVVKKLQASKISLFTNHQLNIILKRKFKKELLEAIKNQGVPNHFKIVKEFSEYKTFENDNFYKRTLENKTLPFVHLNNWVSAFVKAVDADVNGNSNKIFWKEADELFNKIPEQYKQDKNDLEKLSNQSKWFDIKNGCYTYKKVGTKLEPQNSKALWETYQKRQDDVLGKRFFFNYRHFALLRLLQELN